MMPVQAVEAVELGHHSPQRIRASRIIAPQAGPQVNPFAVTLRGWVMGGPVSVRQVELMHENTQMAVLPLSRPNL
jgi:hypothetical protein